jgi:hypothetical protein
MSSIETESVPPLADFIAEDVEAKFDTFGFGNPIEYARIVNQNVATSEVIAKARHAAHMLSTVDVPPAWMPHQEVIWAAAYDHAAELFTAKGLDQVEERALIYADVIALAATSAVAVLAERAALAGTQANWSPWSDLPARQRLAREREERRQIRALYPC